MLSKDRTPARNRVRSPSKLQPSSLGRRKTPQFTNPIPRLTFGTPFIDASLANFMMAPSGSGISRNPPFPFGQSSHQSAPSTSTAGAPDPYPKSLGSAIPPSSASQATSTSSQKRSSHFGTTLPSASASGSQRAGTSTGVAYRAGEAMGETSKSERVMSAADVGVGGSQILHAEQILEPGAGFWRDASMEEGMTPPDYPNTAIRRPIDPAQAGNVEATQTGVEDMPDKGTVAEQGMMKDQPEAGPVDNLFPPSFTTPSKPPRSFVEPKDLIGEDIRIRNMEYAQWPAHRRTRCKATPSIFRPKSIIYQARGITILRCGLAKAFGEPDVEGLTDKVIKLTDTEGEEDARVLPVYREFAASIQSGLLFSTKECPFLEQEAFGVIEVMNSRGGAVRTTFMAITMDHCRTWEEELEPCTTLSEIFRKHYVLWQAVAKCNEQMVHGDLKPSNVVTVPSYQNREGFEARLIDIELALPRDKVSKSGVGGTPTYLAVGPTAKRFLEHAHEALYSKQIQPQTYEKIAAFLNNNRRAEFDPSNMETDQWALGLMLMEYTVPDAMVAHHVATNTFDDIVALLPQADKRLDEILQRLTELFSQFERLYGLQAWIDDLPLPCVRPLLQQLVGRGRGDGAFGHFDTNFTIQELWSQALSGLEAAESIPLRKIKFRRAKISPVGLSTVSVRANDKVSRMAGTTRTRAAAMDETAIQAGSALLKTPSRAAKSIDGGSVGYTTRGNPIVRQPDGIAVEQRIVERNGKPHIVMEPGSTKGRKLYVCRLDGCTSTTSWTAKYMASDHLDRKREACCKWVRQREYSRNPVWDFGSGLV